MGHSSNANVYSNHAATTEIRTEQSNALRTANQDRNAPRTRVVSKDQNALRIVNRVSVLTVANNVLITAMITASSALNVNNVRTTVSSAATNRQIDRITATTTSVVTTRNSKVQVRVVIFSRSLMV